MEFVNVDNTEVPEENVICNIDSKLLIKPNETFYSDSANYWSKIPATVDGMLGGFGHISDTDIQGSRNLLKHLFRSKHPPERTCAVDCGAGIGRITKFLLTNFFDSVDLVEQNVEFLEKAKNYLGIKLAHKIGNYYPVGLQSFVPNENKYDVIWMQWVLGYLTDANLITLLTNCKKGLRQNGVIIIKENIAASKVEIDEADSSITRPYSHYMSIFKKAGLHCNKKMTQPHFPKTLYKVYMFVLKPDECKPVE